MPDPLPLPDAPPQAPPADPPTLTVTLLPHGQEQVKWNMQGPMARTMALWLLKRAELILLTQPTDAERQAQSSGLVKPNGGMGGLRKRMGL